MKQTTDILKRFCELAPPEWEFSNDRGTAIWLYPSYEESALEVHLSDDHSSAEAIIFLWDWLQDQFQFISIIGTEDGFVLERTVLTDDYGWVTKTEDHAPTRIEALVRACVAVLEAKAVAQ